MRVTIVHLAEERLWAHDHDHLAINDQELTLCGRKWSTTTRREKLSDTSERTPCHRCQTKAREKVLLSLQATFLLCQRANLDWSALKMIARVP